MQSLGSHGMDSDVNRRWTLAKNSSDNKRNFNNAEYLYLPFLYTL